LRNLIPYLFKPYYPYFILCIIYPNLGQQPFFYVCLLPLLLLALQQQEGKNAHIGVAIMAQPFNLTNDVAPFFISINHIFLLTPCAVFSKPTQG